MPRRRARLPVLLLAAGLSAAAPARAQQADGAQGGSGSTRAEEPLRRLDPGSLAGGDYGAPRDQPRPLAGGDYGAQTAEQPPLAGGDYGIPSRPEASAATIAPTLLQDPLGAAPRGFRPTRRGPGRLSPDDAYAPPGVKAGSFVLRPTLESAGGYDDNPNRLSGGRGKGDGFVRLRGALDAESDWSRHSLGFRTSGQIRKYSTEVEGLQPDVSAGVTGRLDVTERTQVNSELRASITASRPGDPDATAGLKEEEIGRSAGATLGVAQRFNRLGLQLDGLVDRFTVDDAKLIGGGKADNSDRAYNQYEARLRGSYELSPRLEPFAEVAVFKRDYDKTFRNVDPGETIADRSRLGSDGYALRTGARFELTRLVTGETAIGYGSQTPKDKSLKKVDGLLFDAAVAWTPSALTTVRFNAATAIQETTLESSGGAFTRTLGLAVEHSLRRNFIVTARTGLETSDYRGSGRKDDLYSLGLDAEYRLTRSLALTGSIERFWLDSSLRGEDYRATIVEVGLRLRR